ncbi:MAG: hypothetical protein N2491_01820 [Negativicutes bacterium]|nr:hypothetical protein [Negativicutes bacterium]
MSNYKVLERATITAHRLSRNLLPRERYRMFVEVLRIAQEETGATLDEVVAVLEEAIDRLNIKVSLQQDRQSQWVDNLRRWIVTKGKDIGMEKGDYVFVPVTKVQKWATEQQIPVEQLIASLKKDDGFGRWVESNGYTRYSRSVWIGKENIRCYGFTHSWLKDGEQNGEGY